MKARNLLISFLTVLCVCWGNVALGNTPETQTTEAQVTVKINEVDAENLAEVLDGIGLSRAEAIVQYRTENGRFYSAEELSAVRGIGMATVAKNESGILLSSGLGPSLAGLVFCLIGVYTEKPTRMLSRFLVNSLPLSGGWLGLITFSLRESRN